MSLYYRDLSVVDVVVCRVVFVPVYLVSPAVLSPRIFTTEMLAVHCRWGNGSEAKAPQSCQVLWTEKADWKLDDSF